jgi:hypothetical protein
LKLAEASDEKDAETKSASDEEMDKSNSNTDVKINKAIAKNPRFRCGGLPSGRRRTCFYQVRTGVFAGGDSVSESDKHLLRHRELFLHRACTETLPATHIRGKCDVHLLNELETAQYYLSKQVGKVDFMRN